MIYPQGVGAAVGTFYGTCVAAWYPDPVTTEGKYGGIPGRTDFRAVGRTILRPAFWFAATAGTYTAVECAMEAARNETQDVWNSIVAGMAGGSVIGMTTGRPQNVAAAAIGVGLMMAVIDVSGPKTVRDEKALEHKRNAHLPEKHAESETLAALKEKFPMHKDL